MLWDAMIEGAIECCIWIGRRKGIGVRQAARESKMSNGRLISENSTQPYTLVRVCNHVPTRNTSPFSIVVSIHGANYNAERPRIGAHVDFQHF